MITDLIWWLGSGIRGQEDMIDVAYDDEFVLVI